jgi:hypothetical protein
MTDHLAQVGSALKSALEAPKAKYPLRRHHDDDYWDQIKISLGDLRLSAKVVPRYKTSGLSGDQWRISVWMKIRNPHTGEILYARSFHRMRDLFTYGPHHLYANCRVILDLPSATLIAYRKGVVLMAQDFPTFGDAAIGMGWHVVASNEGCSPGAAPWHHLTDEEERARCQQVGCGDTPVNLFHLKQIDEGKSGGHLVTPPYDFVGQYVWYCARHTQRGDQGLEDCDKNLELVAGPGVARPHAGDESPSALGGVIEVDLGGGEKT